MRPRLETPCGDAGDLGHPGVFIDCSPLRTDRGMQLMAHHRLIDHPGGLGFVVQRLGIDRHQRERSTRLREWAADNLVVVDGEPTAPQVAAAQKATRPAKPESKAWAELTQEWRADARGVQYDRAAHLEAQCERRAAPRLLLDRARLARMVARIDKPAFTRADLVELVGALLPVDVPGDPRALIEQIVDTVGVRVSATRDAHHREGHEMFTVDAVIAEEQRIFEMVDEADSRARLDVRAADLDGLSADQARAIGNIAHAIPSAGAASAGRRG